MPNRHDRTAPDLRNVLDLDEVFNDSLKDVFDKSSNDKNADAKAGTRALWGCAAYSVFLVAFFFAVVFSHRWLRLPASLWPMYSVVFRIVLLGLFSSLIYGHFRYRAREHKLYRENRQAAEMNARLGKKGGYCRNCGGWIDAQRSYVAHGPLSYYFLNVPEFCNVCCSVQVYLYIVVCVVVVASFILPFFVAF